MVSKSTYQSERYLQAVRENLGRELAGTEGERLIELVRLALRAERLTHDITRRTSSTQLFATAEAQGAAPTQEDE